MLTIAVLSTEQKMVVGITGTLAAPKRADSYAVAERLSCAPGDEMLKNKKHGDVMQPYQQRASATVDFLNAINPSVAYEVPGR
jgi:phosphopantetheine adenylyltransferase